MKRRYNYIILLSLLVMPHAVYLMEDSADASSESNMVGALKCALRKPPVRCKEADAQKHEISQLKDRSKSIASVRESRPGGKDGPEAPREDQPDEPLCRTGSCEQFSCGFSCPAADLFELLSFPEKGSEHSEHRSEADKSEYGEEK